MKNLTWVGIILLVFLFSETTYSQERARRHRSKKVVVVKRSKYRPRRVAVFRPAWHPRWTTQRRWVYFPRQNFYWDNWRNHYMIYRGSVWVSQAALPEEASNINLAEEKFYELPEAEDDQDDIALLNGEHKKKFKEN